MGQEEGAAGTHGQAQRGRSTARFTSRQAVSVVLSVVHVSWFRPSARLGLSEQGSQLALVAAVCSSGDGPSSSPLAPLGLMQARSRADARADARVGAARAGAQPHAQKTRARRFEWSGAPGVA